MQRVVIELNVTLIRWNAKVSQQCLGLPNGFGLLTVKQGQVEERLCLFWVLPSISDGLLQGGAHHLPVIDLFFGLFRCLTTIRDLLRWLGQKQFCLCAPSGQRASFDQLDCSGCRFQHLQLHRHIQCLIRVPIVLPRSNRITAAFPNLPNILRLRWAM